jgi:hypothetical protein
VKAAAVSARGSGERRDADYIVVKVTGVTASFAMRTVRGTKLLETAQLAVGLRPLRRQ